MENEMEKSSKELIKKRRQRERERKQKKEEKRKEMHQLIDVLFKEDFSVIVAGKKPHCGNTYSMYGNKSCIVGMINRLLKKHQTGKL